MLGTKQSTNTDSLTLSSMGKMRNKQQASKLGVHQEVVCALGRNRRGKEAKVQERARDASALDPEL